MSVLRDLAVDVINTAKASKDARQKLFQLEQLREIVLHRDKEVIVDVISDVFDFMVDKSVQIRRFLIIFSGDLLEINFSLALPYVIGMFVFFLTESNDSLLGQLTRATAKFYSKIFLSIIAMPATSPESKQLWTGFRNIVTKLHDYLTSARSDVLKAACFRLMEEQILFGLPTQSATMDPRLARKADPRLRTAASTANSTGLEAIPLHHPFINRNEIQREAEDFYSKAILWLAKGGSATSPFSPSCISKLAQLLSSVGSSRTTYCLQSAQAIHVLVTSKQPVITAMNKDDREFLARGGLRLVRAATVLNEDRDGHIAKLKEVINAMDLTSGGAQEALPAEPAAPSLGKRGRIMEDEETEEVVQQRRAQVLLALEQAEAARLAQMTGEESTSTTSLLNTYTQAQTEISPADHAIPIGEHLDISSTLLPVVKLTLCAHTKLVYVRGGGTGGQSMAGLDLTPRPLHTQATDYEEVSLCALMHLLEHYLLMLERGDKAMKMYIKILTQTTLSLVESEVCVEEGMKGVKVQVISSWVAGLSAVEKDNVPAWIVLPRPVWLMVSFLLTLLTHSDLIASSCSFNFNFAHDSVVDLSSVDQQQHVVTILTTVLLGLHELAQDEDELVSKACESIYSGMLLTVLSRLLHHPDLRHLCVDILSSMSYIPPCVIDFVYLAMMHGSKSHVNQSNKGAGRSVRGECLVLLGQLVFTAAEDVAQDCLSRILQMAISPDLESRSRAIGLIVNDLVHMESWVDDAVVGFVLQAISGVLGDRVEAFRMKVAALTPAQVEKAAELQDDQMDVETSGSEGSEGTGTQIEPKQEQAQTQTAEMALAQQEPERKFSLLDAPIPETWSLLSAETMRPLCHLLSQLCLVENNMLQVYAELWAISASDSQAQPQTAAQPQAAGEETKSEPVASSWSLQDQVCADLRSILPALIAHRNKSHSAGAIEVDVFKVLAAAPLPQFSLLIFALHILLPDQVTPPKPGLVQEVCAYLYAQDAGLQAYRHAYLQSKSEEGTDVAELPFSLAHIASDEALKLGLCVVSGLTQAALEGALPRILVVYGEDADGLKNVLLRSIKSRPPVLSKAQLLIALHRVDLESSGLKPKALLDSISLCLNNKADFSGEVIKEALGALAQDSPPPFALMRTAILASQAFTDVRRYLCVDLIPQLVEKAIYLSAPKVWEGCVVAIKTFVVPTNKHNDPTLAALVKLPGVQLKAVLKIAPQAKPLLAKVVQAGGEGMVTAGEDSEKAKILKELAALPLTVTDTK